MSETTTDLFIVTCLGKMEMPEDDPRYGTYRMPFEEELGQCVRLQDAVAQAEDRVTRQNFPSVDHVDLLRFHPELIYIRDSSKRLVYAAQVREGAVTWLAPAASDEETQIVLNQVVEYSDQAAYEAGWDNYSTAEGFRRHARMLKAHIVDPSWRAVALAVHLSRPRFEMGSAT